MARRAALIKRTPKTVRTTKTETYLVNQKYLGDEPTFKNSYTQSDYARALSWYHAQATLSEAREYIETYLKNTGRTADLKKFKSVPDNWVPTTAAWIARMINRGIKVFENSQEYLERKLIETLEKHASNNTQEVKVEKVNVVSIQDRIRDKANDLIGDVEEMIDKNETFSLYDWLKANEIPATYAPRIAAYYAPVLAELIEASEGLDPQLKEGYKHFTKKQLEQRIMFFNTLIEDAERYSDTTKKARVPRKPRTVSVEKKLKNFKYQKEDNNYKIASINPEKIIGCQELWTFNTKYKTLTVFRALDRGGLQVKGTSIINYDEKNSVTKRTGRKPEVYVDKVLNGGKVVLRKLTDEMKNDAPLAYRINENTILLKVVT
ncbi:MAG: hypothetical protein [Caudoviricetes sp.]|nr:MAG: hypothetical protein [Caudoviricetes sp.]